MHCRSLALALALGGTVAAASAQVAAADSGWQEAAAPPPPALRTSGLLPLDVSGSSLRFGVDPDSITIGSDSVVRYVVVASDADGLVSAMYEGLRCGTAEVKTYARHNQGSSGWVPARDADWQPLRGRGGARHSLVFARSGACDHNAPNRPASKIVRELKSSVDEKLR